MTPEAERIWRQYARRLVKAGATISSHPEVGSASQIRVSQVPKILRIEAQIVRAWNNEGLITQQADNIWQVSDVGLASLRRYLGGIRSQHQIVEVKLKADGQLQSRNVTSSALDWLTSKKGGRFTLSPGEHEAAKAFCRDYEQARMIGRMTMDWSERVGRLKSRRQGGHDSLPANALDARRRVNKALTFVGPGLADILVEACCNDRSLQESEALFALPARSGKLMIKLSLARLALFYGFQSSSEATASLRMR